MEMICCDIHEEEKLPSMLGFVCVAAWHNFNLKLLIFFSLLYSDSRSLAPIYYIYIRYGPQPFSQPHSLG